MNCREYKTHGYNTKHVQFAYVATLLVNEQIPDLDNTERYRFSFIFTVIRP